MRRHLKELPQPPKVHPLDEAVDLIAKRHGVTAEALLNHNRRRFISHARQEVFWLARKEGLSYPEIATYFDMDHTTVIHGFRQVERRISESFK